MAPQTHPFDSTRDAGYTFEIGGNSINRNRIVPGLEIAVQSMQKGEEAFVATKKKGRYTCPSCKRIQGRIRLARRNAIVSKKKEEAQETDHDVYFGRGEQIESIYGRFLRE